MDRNGTRSNKPVSSINGQEVSPPELVTGRGQLRELIQAGDAATPTVPPKPRRLQLAWRELVMRLILGMLSSADAQSPSVEEMFRSGREIRVLYIRSEMKIGDLIMNTGIIRAIAQSSPHISLDVLASDKTAAVLLNNPRVTKIYEYKRNEWWGHPGLWFQLRRRRFDILVDGRTNHPPWHTTVPLFMIASGCRVRVGAACEHRGLYTVPVTVGAGLHFVEQAAAVTTPFGVPSTTDFRPELFPSPSELSSAEAQWKSQTHGEQRRVRLLVNVSAAGSRRRWPDGRFAEVIAGVRDHPLRPNVVVISSNRDRESAANVVAATGAVLVPTPDLRDAIALVATCDLLLTPDTGTAHIGSAFKKRVVDLLLARPEAPGPLMPRDATAPYRTPGRNLYSSDMMLSSLDSKPVTDAVWQELDECSIALRHTPTDPLSSDGLRTQSNA